MKISWYYARSILTWISSERNSGYFNFDDKILEKLRNIKVNGKEGRSYTFDISVGEAKKIIEAMYVNSAYEDSSTPYDEIKFLMRYAKKE